VLERCIVEGLVGGEGFAVDASLVQADASRRRHHEEGVADRSGLALDSGATFYAYSTNYLIDTEAGIIMDVEATPANRSFEVASTRTMIGRVAERFAIKPKKLIGDTACGSAKLLGWLVEK